ncbi:glycosyltransferase [Lactiplantibacillus sp. WILCCON 0030]|uniref:Glycosyltransferase n=1 Tax=Lactiplantibacillus brownii TaxID=3069269 RepID=A0ABU1A9V5_9LACO|nr:glycosyltransferase [Lactiplantibacillus brownii]MDQ7937714.1 glycosyltransferase [Lactiplantibacillus brownii]
MIPKIIHYCWFGQQPLPPKVLKCLASWQKFCPEYELKRWDETNIDVNQNPFLKTAYDSGKYAFVSDFVRLDVIYRYGGVYLDTDVELLKPLDLLKHYQAFFGMEAAGRVNTGLGFGAEPQSRLIYELRKSYLVKNDNGSKGFETCVERNLPVFRTWGLLMSDETQCLAEGQVIVYATEYLDPKSLESGKVQLTSKTIAIHHYDASWKSQAWLAKRVTRLKIKAHRQINQLFGEGTYEALKRRILGRASD